MEISAFAQFWLKLQLFILLCSVWHEPKQCSNGHFSLVCCFAHIFPVLCLQLSCIYVNYSRRSIQSIKYFKSVCDKQFENRHTTNSGFLQFTHIFTVIIMKYFRFYVAVCCIRFFFVHHHYPSFKSTQIRQIWFQFLLKSIQCTHLCIHNNVSAELKTREKNTKHHL